MFKHKNKQIKKSDRWMLLRRLKCQYCTDITKCDVCLNLFFEKGGNKDVNKQNAGNKV